MNEYQTPAAVTPPTEDERRYRAMRDRCSTGKGAAVTLGALLVGWLFCDGFILSSAGASLFVLIAGYQALVWALFRDRGIPRPAMLLAIPIVLLPLGHLLHFNPSTRWIATLTLLLLCALQIVVLGGVACPFSMRALGRLLERLLVQPLVNLGLPFAALGSLRNTKSKAVRTAAAGALGVALALPVGGVLLCLFASADAFFSDSLGRFFSTLRLSPFAFFVDLTIGGVLGAMLAACLLGTRYGEASAGKETALRRVPALVSGAFLAAIDAVTALFVAFQFVYLFGGESTRAVAGMTYSEYARRGFFELCAASAIVFAVSLAALLLTREGRGMRPVRVLAGLLAACDFVVLASACKRMALYVETYGMSIKRLLALWGMAVVAVGLALLLVRCVRERFAVLRNLGIAAVAAVCVLSLANTDGIVAEWNVRAVERGQIHRGLGAFDGLSYCAAPALVRLRGTGDEAFEQELTSRMETMRRELELRHPFYSFCLDDLAARAAFREAGLQ